MKEIIDFDKKFVEYLEQWAQDLLDKGKKPEEIEEMIPETYSKFSKQAEEYFSDMNIDELAQMLGAYLDEEITPPDELVNLITAKSEGEDKLVEMLRQERSNQDKIMLMGMLSSSDKPVEDYLKMILSYEDEELVEGATEALKYIPSQKLGPIKNAMVETDDMEIKERLVYILVYASPKTEGLADTLIYLLNNSPNKAVIAGLMASYGDEKCLPELKKAENFKDIDYIAYVEICDAIEELGGETTREREFDGDDYYEMMHSGGLE